MRLIDKDRLLKGSNHYLMRLDEDSIALGDIESIDVRFVEMAEEVKAIPIEWIEKYIKQNYCTCDLVYPEEFLKELVTWWGEENESNVSN